MKISYRWLGELVESGLEARVLAERLTMAGLAVDAVEQAGDDEILDFDLTSNRPDCLSHLGIAREVAAITGRQLRLPVVDLQESSETAANLTSVEILDPDLCPRYSARLIRGVKIGPSPDWMVRRLEALGQRSINNVADITNYVMLEMGQPLHAFDFNRLAGRRIVVRCARPGERLVTLDGVERELQPDMLVIADERDAVALAGIMGGGESEITDSTRDVLLESAYFTPSSIRQTARALGMGTEASYRFERGTDYENVIRASARAAALIAELAGGEICSGVVDVKFPLPDSRPIPLRIERYRQLTGLDTDLTEAARILRALGLSVEEESGEGRLWAIAPSWRSDLWIEEDLVEEVARISGYENLESTLPGSAGAGAYLAGEQARRYTRRALLDAGFYEAISFSFVNAEDDRLFGEESSGEELVLSNPIDETQNQMRTTLLGGLLGAVERNINHGTKNLRLFEMGKCFLAHGEERPREVERLSLIMTGARNERDWLAASERVDFYDLKGAIEAVADILGKKALEFRPAPAIGYLHPGRAAVISLAGKEIGLAGQLHPKIATKYKFKQPVLLAELDFGALLDGESVEARYRPLPRYPAVTRHLSALLDEVVTFAEIEQRIENLAIPELVEVRLFDLYTGKELPPAKRALALSFKYRAADRTLTEEEINNLHGRVVEMLVRDLAAEIR